MSTFPLFENQDTMPDAMRASATSSSSSSSFCPSVHAPCAASCHYHTVCLLPHPFSTDPALADYLHPPQPFILHIPTLSSSSSSIPSPPVHPPAVWPVAVTAASGFVWLGRKRAPNDCATWILLQGRVVSSRHCKLSWTQNHTSSTDGSSDGGGDGNRSADDSSSGGGFRLFLEDCSMNGTELNGESMGKGMKAELLIDRENVIVVGQTANQRPDAQFTVSVIRALPPPPPPTIPSLAIPPLLSSRVLPSSSPVVVSPASQRFSSTVEGPLSARPSASSPRRLGGSADRPKEFSAVTELLVSAVKEKEALMERIEQLKCEQQAMLEGCGQELEQLKAAVEQMTKEKAEANAQIDKLQRSLQRSSQTTATQMKARECEWHRVRAELEGEVARMREGKSRQEEDVADMVICLQATQASCQALEREKGMLMLDMNAQKQQIVGVLLLACTYSCDVNVVGQLYQTSQPNGDHDTKAKRTNTTADGRKTTNAKCYF
eukprot:GHVS01032980.1.p1 GENE.GHVS01032980.1~~GHVS01032980.1.p1  ORF type:complete len:491 (+),score=115.67 GHVS01032980.1:319-1791(+)